MGMFDQVTEVIDGLKAAGIRDVSLDAALVKVPGVWVKAPTVSDEILAGHVLRLELVAVVSQATPERALVELGELLELMFTVISPIEPAYPATIQMPDGSICPCFFYPIELYTQ